MQKFGKKKLILLNITHNTYHITRNTFWESALPPPPSFHFEEELQEDETEIVIVIYDLYEMEDGRQQVKVITI